MAFQTGSQLRPELSAVNYTPFLQAAGQSAQMQAQGIADLARGAVKGFESFVEQQKQNKQLEAKVKSGEKIAVALGGLLKDVNPEAATQFGGLVSGISDPNASLRDRAAMADSIGPALNNILNLAQLGKQTQDAQMTAQYEQMLAAGGGQVPTPYAPAAVDRFTASQKMAAEQAYLQRAKTKAEIGELQAKAKALGTPKVPDMSFQEQALAAAEQAAVTKVGRPLTPVEKADLYAQVAQMSRPSTNVTVGEGPALSVYKELDAKKKTITSLREVSSAYDDAINEITKEGAFSGPTGAIKYAGARALQFFGSDAFKNEADAYQSAASSIAGAVLSYARQLPGSASDKDVMFLERVASGNERVASKEALIKLKDRVDRKYSRLQSDLSSDISAFGESAKGDKSMEFLHKMLSTGSTSQQPVSIPTITQGPVGSLQEQAKAILEQRRKQAPTR